MVEQFYGEFIEKEDAWELELLFDVGYASEEGRGDAESPAPSYDWLISRSPEEFEELRKGSEAYLRECLSFFQGEEVLEVTYHFRDFETTPAQFHRNVLDWAYFRVVISAPVAPSVLGLKCRLSEGERPDFVMGRRNAAGEMVYLTMKPGEELLINEAGEASGWFVFQQGFRHVIPLGLDHIFFILALFLANRSWRFLLEQSLVFTLAHSVTLGMAAAGVIVLSGSWVEPLIALSIVFLGLENLFMKSVRGRRLGLVFLFGLVHGLGFAAVLKRFLSSGDHFLGHLALMNIGVEVAQLVVLGLAGLVALGWSHTQAYRRATIGANIALCVVAGWWFIERI